jgi:hypothetical protein
VDVDHDNAREPYGQLWRGSYTELARLYDLTIIGFSNVGWLTGGPWQGRKCIGCSLAVGPGGEILAQGPYGEDVEALIGVEVQAQRLRRQRLGPVTSYLAASGDRPAVRRLVILPSPWLAGVPVELIAEEYTVSNALSGTLYAHLKKQTAVATQGLLALGDPVFKKPQ